MSPIEFSSQDPALLWAVSLVIGFALAILTLGEINHRWQQRRHRLTVPIRHLRALVVPTLAVYLMLTRVVGLHPNSLWARLALTAFLIGLIYAMLSLLKAVLFVGFDEKSWQRKVPRLLTDLVRLTLVLVGSMFVLSAVWGQNLSQMLTALGVGSIVLGLALQEPLGNVFSGVFLLIERPVEVGDWIEIDDKTGQVTEINWRSVHLVTRMMELVVFPNSVLAQRHFKNLSRPKQLLYRVLEIGFSYDDPPNKVKRILEDVVRQTPGVLLDPPPVIQTKTYADFSIKYDIKFCLAEYSRQVEVRDELMTRIWYAARRHELTIPYPISTEIHATQDEMAVRARQHSSEDLVGPLQGLGVGLAHQAELAARLQQASLRSYGRGEIVVHEGEKLAGLHLIIRGQAILRIRNDAGQQQELGHLGQGEFFGERALLSRQTSDITVEAAEDLEILILDGELLQSALETSPRVAREIGSVIEVRDRELRRARGGNKETEAA